MPVVTSTRQPGAWFGNDPGSGHRINTLAKSVRTVESVLERSGCGDFPPFAMPDDLEGACGDIRDDALFWDLHRKAEPVLNHSCEQAAVRAMVDANSSNAHVMRGFTCYHTQSVFIKHQADGTRFEAADQTVAFVFYSALSPVPPPPALGEHGATGLEH